MYYVTKHKRLRLKNDTFFKDHLHNKVKIIQLKSD